MKDAKADFFKMMELVETVTFKTLTTKHYYNYIMKEQVLQAMREAGKPVSAGEVTKALGADWKEVDKAFTELKKEGAIISPVRCKWTPAQ